MALVLEQMLLEQRHAGDDAGFAAGGEGVQLELRRDESGRELSIGSSTGTGAPNLGGYVMKLLAVLVGDDGTTCGSSIGGDLGKHIRADISRRGEERGEGGGELTTTPPSYIHPTIVVPVLVALGNGTPRAWRAALRL